MIFWNIFFTEDSIWVNRLKDELAFFFSQTFKYYSVHYKFPSVIQPLAHISKNTSKRLWLLKNTCCPFFAEMTLQNDISKCLFWNIYAQIFLSVVSSTKALKINELSQKSVFSSFLFCFKNVCVVDTRYRDVGHSIFVFFQIRPLSYTFLHISDVD